MGIYNVHIAGVKFKPGAADALDAMEDGIELELRLEPENKFDPTAVAICYGYQQVGYVPGYISEKITNKIKTNEIIGAFKEEGHHLSIHYGETSVKGDNTDG